MLYLLHRDPFDSRSIFVYLIMKGVSSLLLISCNMCHFFGLRCTSWDWADQVVGHTWNQLTWRLQPRGVTLRCECSLLHFVHALLCVVFQGHCCTHFLSKLQGFRLIAFPFLFSNTPSLLLTSCMSCPSVPTLNGCTHPCINDDNPIMYIYI